MTKKLKKRLYRILLGAAAFAVYKLLMMLCGINIISLFAAIIIAVIVYFVAVIKVSGTGEEDLIKLPKGRILVRMAKKVHLLK